MLGQALEVNLGLARTSILVQVSRHVSMRLNLVQHLAAGLHLKLRSSRSLMIKTQLFKPTHMFLLFFTHNCQLLQFSAGYVLKHGATAIGSN